MLSGQSSSSLPSPCRDGSLAPLPWGIIPSPGRGKNCRHQAVFLVTGNGSSLMSLPFSLAWKPNFGDFLLLSFLDAVRMEDTQQPWGRASSVGPGGGTCGRGTGRGSPCSPLGPGSASVESSPASLGTPPSCVISGDVRAGLRIA